MRLRVRFCKTGKIRWTSHRDVARMWERAFRRLSLPLAYTQGFSPRPKVSFGLALSTGHESVAEYLDLELVEGTPLDVTTLANHLSTALPAGIDVQALAVIDDRAGSLQEEVTSCDWRIEVAGVDADRLAELAAAALAADSLVVTRQRKGHDVTDDVRPAILTLEAGSTDTADAVLWCELATQPRGLRPGELLAAVGPGLEEVQVRRLHQWIQRDGARREPIALPFDATDAPPVPMGRAS
jgi:radical SAM-linked protein